MIPVNVAMATKLHPSVGGGTLGRVPRPARSTAEVDADEPSRLRHSGQLLAGLADDLPFVPHGPYEPRRLQLAWRALVLAGLVALAFWTTLGNELLWQDDRHVVADLALRTLGGLGAIWRHPLAADAPPGVRTLWWLLAHTAGTGPLALRTVGLVLHVTTVVVAWWAMRRLGVTGAWLVAGAFAVHPAVLANVAWVSRQGELLGTAAAAVAFWAWLVGRRVHPPADERAWTDPSFHYHEDDDAPPVRWPWLLFVVAAAVSLSAGSPAGVVVAAGLWWVERRLGLTASAASRAALVAFAVVAVATRLVFPVGTTVTGPAPVGGAGWAEAAAGLPWTLAAVLVPGATPFGYDRVAWPASAWLFALAGVTAVVLALPLLRRRVWTVVLAAAAVLTALQGLSAGRRTAPLVLTADLVPYAAGLLVTAAVLTTALRRLRTHATPGAARLLRWTVGGIVLAVLGYLTSDAGPAYAQSDALWQRTLALTPDAVVPRLRLADNYLAENFVAEAGPQLDGVPDARRDPAWLMARARVFERLNDTPSAVACYAAAHARVPGDRPTTVLLAESLVAVGRPDEAAKLYTGLIDAGDADAPLYTNAGLVQMRLGRAQDAADLYAKAIALDDDYLPARIDSANARFELGDLPGASAELKEAVRIDPHNFPAFLNAGVILHRLNDQPNAERMFRAAVTLNPRSADAFDDLGVVLAAQQKSSEALWAFTQAARLEPDHPAQQHLQQIKRQLAVAATRPR